MPLELKYFTLKPRSKKFGDAYAKASREAIKAYAFEIQKTDFELHCDLLNWVEKEEKKEEFLKTQRDE